MAIRSRTGLIKRYKVPMVYRRYDDSFNTGPFDNEGGVINFEKRVAEECTIQSPSRNNTTPEMQGLDPTTTYVIYTNSYVPQSSDGENDQPCGFYIPNAWLTVDPSYPANSGGWYKVVSVQQKLNRVINHYKVVVVRDDNITNGEYPDTAAFDAEVTTRDEFLSGTWEATWLLP